MSLGASTVEPSLAEEIVHSITHGVGALLAAGALVGLVIAAALAGGAVATAASAVFGSTLLILYLASTLYHALPPALTRAKAVFRIFDHAAIHLLIAGTYTPFALCALGGVAGWTLLALSWALAAFGIVVEATPLRRRTRLSIALYLASGWLCVPALPALFQTLPWPPLVLLALGGLAYTGGVAFYVSERRWMHTCWHGFVLVGSALHVASVALIVVR